MRKFKKAFEKVNRTDQLYTHFNAQVGYLTVPKISDEFGERF